jgi:hypothetical protein
MRRAASRGAAIGNVPRFAASAALRLKRWAREMFHSAVGEPGWLTSSENTRAKEIPVSRRGLDRTAVRLSVGGPWPSLRGCPMPPLQLNDEEVNVLLTLAGPIDHQLRPQSAGGRPSGVECGVAAPRLEVHSKVKGDGAERSGLVRPSGRSPPVIDARRRARATLALRIDDRLAIAKAQSLSLSWPL